MDGNDLLAGEDPGTNDPEAVRRWTSIYTELIAFKTDLVSRIEAERGRLGPAPRAEISRDLEMVSQEKARLEARLAFWRVRQLRLGESLDGKELLHLVFGDKDLRLSRREAQLLGFLASNTDTRFAAQVLATRAWHDHALSAAQVRNYVSRLRQKLQQADAPCRIETVGGNGYSLTWRPPDEALTDASGSS
jgi:DNA-binding response OmpR family regulator